MKGEKFAVIGHPIGHTMSPFIHDRLFELSGMKADYSVLDITDIKKDEALLRELDGFNITIPHKRNIFNILDSCDSKAQVVGSVNTVKNEGGYLTGYTTDGEGCLKALNNHGEDLTGKIMMLGSGGAARAIAFEAAFCKSATDITIVVRETSLPKGEALKRDLMEAAPDADIKVSTYAQENKSDELYDLLINATSVGMYPNSGCCPADDSIIGRCSAVFDAVYNPGDTLLLKKAAAMGKKIIPGMEMLVLQAAAAHEHWYQAVFRKDDIVKLCRDAEEEMNRIFA